MCPSQWCVKVTVAEVSFRYRHFELDAVRAVIPASKMWGNLFGGRFELIPSWTASGCYDRLVQGEDLTRSSII